MVRVSRESIGSRPARRVSSSAMRTSAPKRAESSASSRGVRPSASARASRRASSSSARAASTSATRVRLQRTTRRVVDMGLHQYDVVLLLGVVALHLEADRLADELLQVGHRRRLLVEQAVHYRLGGQHHVGLGAVGALLAEDLAEDLVADRLGGLEGAASTTGGAGLAEGLLQALPGALAGKLHQPQLGDPGALGLGVVPLQGLLEHAQHLALVLGVLHVDEVDDDDAAEIAQAQLPGDGGSGLEVGLEDGLLEVAMPHVAAGVDVDGGHRLGGIDDEVSPGLQLHLAPQGLLDLVLDAEQVEDRPLPGVV